MREIQLTRGHVALVDDEDYDWLSQWKWYADGVHKLLRVGGPRVSLYAARGRRSSEVGARLKMMHRELLGAAADQEVDHRDGNGLNNQRLNLRLCTHAENMRNVRRRRSSSRFKGVYFAAARTDISRRWVARVTLDGRPRNLGYFADEASAAEAYDDAAAELFGEYALLNRDLFPGLLLGRKSA